MVAATPAGGKRRSVIRQIVVLPGSRIEMRVAERKAARRLETAATRHRSAASLSSATAARGTTAFSRLVAALATIWTRSGIHRTASERGSGGFLILLARGNGRVRPHRRRQRRWRTYSSGRRRGGNHGKGGLQRPGQRCRWTAWAGRANTAIRRRGPRIQSAGLEKIHQISKGRGAASCHHRQ